MHKPAAHTGVAFCNVVQHAVHQVVAHKGARCVGNGGRQAFLVNGIRHCLNGQQRKIRRGAVCKNGGVDRLITLVIRDTGIVHVNGHPLWCQVKPAAGLANAKHHVGLHTVHLCRHCRNGLLEHCGHFQFNDFGIAHFVRNLFYRFQRGVYLVAAKRVKCC